jgi:preprotein translocase subunit SecA
VSTPTEEYRRLGYRFPPRLPKGLDALVSRGVGYYQRRDGLLSGLREEAGKIDAQASDWKDLPDHQLHLRLMEFREKFRRGGKGVETLVLTAFAAIREAAHRQLRMHPFVVQMMGALALHRGYLAEMATGEGKTLTAGLAAVLAGWTRRPAHVVTVNDYLVERDAEWMRPLYHFCGVRVGFVTAAMVPAERGQGYDADVTYVTSKELLADFLRDRLRLRSLTNPSRRLLREIIRPTFASDNGLVLRGLHTAIVDEADSILIDEAVTPLIISAPQENEVLVDAVRAAQHIAVTLRPGEDYQPNLRYREIEFTRPGREQIARACAALPGLWRGSERRNELLRQALVAREFFHQDKHYIIADSKIVIVDESTGRQMPHRTWREGLHQAIEAKEGLPVSAPSETIARLSFQRFFRCFHKLAGMSGTAREASGEFWQIYRLPVLAIPTNRPCLRQHLPDRVFVDETAKWQAVVAEIARLHATGRPILVGTRSVAASERLAAMLEESGFEFQLLNAVRHKDEAVIVAMAGALGRITIATNMAGRGTDIKLGEGVAALGGLHVLATERHESGRVDRQLFGRAARQGDPGSAQAFVSLRDELILRHLPGARQSTPILRFGRVLAGRQRLSQWAFALAQRRAQAAAFKQRQAVLRADTWLEESLSFAGQDV